MINIFVLLLVFLKLEHVVSSSNQTILFAYSIRENNNNGIQYKHTLNNLLNTFSSQAINKGFYNSTTFGQTPNNNLYGLYMCRGDVDRESCRACVEYAKEFILEGRSYRKEAMVWYDHCMLRYSNEPFFGKLDVVDKSMRWEHENITSNTTRFMQILMNTMNYMAIRASYGREGRKFATKVVKFTKDENLYMLMQCTPDLTSNDCHKCLRHSIRQIRLFGASNSGMVMHRNCMVRYETFPFFYSNKIKSFDTSPKNSRAITLHVRVESLPLDDNSIINSTSSSVAANSPSMIKFRARTETSPFHNSTVVEPALKCLWSSVPSNSTLIKRNGSEVGARSD